MHRQLIKAASDEQLRAFTMDAMTMIKETNYDLYEDLEEYLYREMYGCHFTDWMLEKATSKLINEDGSTGPHWNVSQTTSVAKQNGIAFDTFNEYDWNYVMNIMYSDYYNVGSNDVSFYVKMARNFLMDKDAKQGKALIYYRNIAI